MAMGHYKVMSLVSHISCECNTVSLYQLLIPCLQETPLRDNVGTSEGYLQGPKLEHVH